MSGGREGRARFGPLRPSPLWPALAGLCLAAAGCAPERAPSVLDPHGLGARRIEGLWWLMFWISVVVFLVVLGFLAAAYMRARRGAQRPQEARWGEPVVVVGGIVAPSLILAAVFVVSLRDMMALSAPPEEARLSIEVIGHDWWWEVRYPDSGAVTANEIHIPVGEPVNLRLSTGDVIHSFWVPQLQAKTDMITGEVTNMWLEADRPGRYRGQCAEFCGLQHAQMVFYVVADPPREFEQWLDNEASPAGPGAAGAVEGRKVFLGSSCAGCHAIRGTPADGNEGPDLTHLAQRQTIAGILENTRDNLRLWVTDPQKVKPGAIMPPAELTPAELDALLDYLQSLN